MEDIYGVYLHTYFLCYISMNAHVAYSLHICLSKVCGRIIELTVDMITVLMRNWVRL